MIKWSFTWKVLWPKYQSMNKRRSSGFTLIEILIALFIFAIISTMTVLGLGEVIRSYRSISHHQKLLQRLSLAVTLMRQDVGQIVIYPWDQSGSKESLSFLRAGLVNPFDLFHRSDLEKVTYRIESGQLVRLASMFDSNTKDKEISMRQMLLDHVVGMQVQYIDQRGILNSQWPPKPLKHASSALLPIGIKIILTLKPASKMTLVLPIVSGRLYAKP